MSRTAATAASRSVAISPAAWKRARWGWSAAVRRDASLSTTARLLADVLAFDYANADSARCDPGYPELATHLGCSKDSIKRAMRDLKLAGWIARDANNSGRNVRVVFLSRGSVTALSDHPKYSATGGKNAPDRGCKNAPDKGCKNAPDKGGKNAPSDVEGGAKMHPTEGKFAPPYIIDKPYKNHRGTRRQAVLSPNPEIRGQVNHLVRDIRNGTVTCTTEIHPDWLDHLVATGLLSEAELIGIGVRICNEGEASDD